jgi:hypothetical protein
MALKEILAATYYQSEALEQAKEVSGFEHCRLVGTKR